MLESPGRLQVRSFRRYRAIYGARTLSCLSQKPRRCWTFLPHQLALARYRLNRHLNLAAVISSSQPWPVCLFIISVAKPAKRETVCRQSPIASSQQAQPMSNRSSLIKHSWPPTRTAVPRSVRYLRDRQPTRWYSVPSTTDDKLLFPFVLQPWSRPSTSPPSTATHILSDTIPSLPLPSPLSPALLLRLVTGASTSHRTSRAAIIPSDQRPARTSRPLLSRD